MYRDYEDPHALEEQLKELLNKDTENMTDEEVISHHDDIEELKYRINLAWQDNEAAMNGED